MPENLPRSDATTLLGAGLLQHIINYSRDAVIVVSSGDLIICDVAQKTCSMLGRSREELIGTHLSTVECSLQDLFSGTTFDKHRSLLIPELLKVNG